jgi:hypothetical protein
MTSLAFCSFGFEFKFSSKTFKITVINCSAASLVVVMRHRAFNPFHDISVCRRGVALEFRWLLGYNSVRRIAQNRILAGDDIWVFKKDEPLRHT